MERVDKFFNGRLPDAIAGGKLSFNARLRYEVAEQSGLATSRALTVSPSFGFTTAPVYGFQGMIEGENVTSILDRDDYNAAGSNGQPGKTVIADPPVTELNQVWLSYSNWKSTVKGGRQRVVLDNARFVGDVDWRQNQQTYDSVTLTSRPLDKLTLFYGYIWEVRRIFGDVASLPAGNRNFDSDSHLFNVSYTVNPYLKLTGYSYLLDLENSPANSSATYGGAVSGAWSFAEGWRLNYGGEFAWQTDHGNNPANYGTDYERIEVSADYKRWTAGAGMERLGADNGMGFRTPLATLAKFNGWADVYLNTPGRGLRDVYGFAQVRLPWDLPLRVDYHAFASADGRVDYGREVNVTLTRKFGKNWMFLARYAYHEGDQSPNPPAAALDVQKVWIEMNFTY